MQPHANWAWRTAGWTARSGRSGRKCAQRQPGGMRLGTLPGSPLSRARRHCLPLWIANTIGLSSLVRMQPKCAGVFLGTSRRLWRASPRMPRHEGSARGSHPPWRRRPRGHERSTNALLLGVPRRPWRGRGARQSSSLASLAVSGEGAARGGDSPSASVIVRGEGAARGSCSPSESVALPRSPSVRGEGAAGDRCYSPCRSSLSVTNVQRTEVFLSSATLAVRSEGAGARLSSLVCIPRRRRRGRGASNCCFLRRPSPSVQRARARGVRILVGPPRRRGRGRGTPPLLFLGAPRHPWREGVARQHLLLFVASSSRVAGRRHTAVGLSSATLAVRSEGLARCCCSSSAPPPSVPRARRRAEALLLGTPPRPRRGRGTRWRLFSSALVDFSGDGTWGGIGDSSVGG